MLTENRIQPISRERCAEKIPNVLSVIAVFKKHNVGGKETLFGGCAKLDILLWVALGTHLHV